MLRSRAGFGVGDVQHLDVDEHVGIEVAADVAALELEPALRQLRFGSCAQRTPPARPVFIHGALVPGRLT